MPSCGSLSMVNYTGKTFQVVAWSGVWLERDASMSAWVAHLKTSPRTEATPEAVVLATTAAQPQATAGSLSLTETWLEKHDRRLKEWAEEQRELQDSWAEKGKERQKEHEDWFKEFLADGEAQHQQRLAGMARVSTAAPVADPEPLPDIQPHEGRNPDGRPSGGLPASWNWRDRAAKRTAR